MGIDLTRRPVRTWVEARLLDLGRPMAHRAWGRFLQRHVGDVEGTLVEIGPGTGANMRYVPAGVHVIGIEPNPGMHQRLVASAAEHDVDLEVRTLKGEGMDVADGAADAVLGTLVLCGVDDPAQVLREVRRILRPGGRYVFVEHVGARPGTALRRTQEVVRGPHRWMFNGCDVTRDTAASIREAGFADVELEVLEGGPTDLYVRPVIRGVATA